MAQRRRDEFSKATRHHLARSVNYLCSKCDAPSAAPFSGGGKSITTGEAAHICAAAPGGPRYDVNMTPEQRVHYDNGIWLCAAHAPLVDLDWRRYSVEDLRSIKRNAEAKATANLEHARIKASLQPVLDGTVEWHDPPTNETRPGYAGLHHAVFRLGGTHKQRGRVYIDIDVGAGTPRRTRACMGEGTDSLAHELGALRPGQPYAVPACTLIASTSKFWLDRRFVPDHPFWSEPADFTLRPGTYLTDHPFLDRVHRQPLPSGIYRLAVVVILGDAEHERTFTSDWKEIRVVP
jgi:hypothetical protein